MSDPFYGQIEMFGFSFAPRDWAFCNGALLSIAQNTTLYSLLGVFYGGDGRSSFGLPNLTSRTGVGFNMGNATNLSRFPLGTRGGGPLQSLTIGDLANHTHGATFTHSGSDDAEWTATTEAGVTATPSAGTYLAAPSGVAGPDKPEQIFKSGPSEGSLVDLGGVSGGGTNDGTVTLEHTGASQQFSVENPIIALNFCIALNGIYPSRN